LSYLANFDVAGLKARFVFVHYCMRKRKIGRFCRIKSLDIITERLGRKNGVEITRFYPFQGNLGDVVDYVDFLFSVLLIIFETADVDTTS